jgi:hypothetical protein
MLPLPARAPLTEVEGNLEQGSKDATERKDQCFAGWRSRDWGWIKPDLLKIEGARLIARGATLTASRPLGHWFIHLFKQLSHFHGMERHKRLQVGVAIEPAQHRLVIAR